MDFKEPIKASAKALVRMFPNTSNRAWKLIYANLLYKGERHREFAQMQAEPDKDVRAGTFGKIFQNNAWKNSESISGFGSTLYNTTVIRAQLPLLLERLEVETLLDAPCGDFNWMQHLALPDSVKYIGCDIVPELVQKLNDQHSSDRYSFKVADIVEDDLPPADFWLCRDALFHLPLKDGVCVIQRARQSGVKYFASTTYEIAKVNNDIPVGAFRFINLELPPYNLPRPLYSFDDFLAPNPPRRLGIWSGEQLQSCFEN